MQYKMYWTGLVERYNSIMKRIKLTQGKYAIVDDNDYDRVSQYKWCAVYIKGTWYATRRANDENPYKPMHRFILKAKKGEEVDHINRNGLDNRKQNIRICDRETNLKNRKIWGNSRYKGVSFHSRDKVWQAYKKIAGKQIYIGSFISEREASLAIGRDV